MKLSQLRKPNPLHPKKGEVWSHIDDPSDLMTQIVIQSVRGRNVYFWFTVDSDKEIKQLPVNRFTLVYSKVRDRL